MHSCVRMHVNMSMRLVYVTITHTHTRMFIIHTYAHKYAQTYIQKHTCTKMHIPSWYINTFQPKLKHRHVLVRIVMHCCWHSVHTLMHICIHTLMHTCIHTYPDAYMHTCIHTYPDAYMHITWQAFVRLHTFDNIISISCKKQKNRYKKTKT